MNPGAIAHFPPGRFKVGDHVQFQRVFDTIQGVVVEDCGPIGYRGRRLYEVRYEIPDSEPFEVPIAEEKLQLVASANGSPRHKTRKTRKT
jgi:hypothetical protein